MKPRSVFSILIVYLFCSCAGPTQLSLIPTSASTIEPDGPLQYDFSPQQCYWWADSENNVRLAMDYHGFSLMGDYTRDSLELSLLLGEPPADQSREYPANRKTARGLWRRGGFHLRMQSRSGIAVVQKQSGNVLAGRFRLTCTTERFDVLLGWVRQSQVLILGRFSAVHDQDRGRLIWDRSEKDQPRTSPASTPTFERGS